ncbi:hypothetical protein PG994_014055, partial [Apiospora phragmitis]
LCWAGHPRPVTAAEMDINPVANPELFSDESEAALLYVMITILLVIASVVVGLRIYTRAVVLDLLSYDDWLCLVSLSTYWALGGTALNLVGKGLGRHVGTLPQPDGFRDYMKVRCQSSLLSLIETPSHLTVFFAITQTFFVLILFYNLAIASFKFCLLAQYYRIISAGRTRYFVLAATGFVTAWTLSQIFIIIFQCKPISGFWEPGPDVKCLPIFPGWYFNAAGNITADIVVLLLPLPTIRGLNLPRAQKVVLGFIFCLGFLYNGKGREQTSEIPPPLLLLCHDTDTHLFLYQFWSIAEVCTGILCVTLPTLRPLAIKWFPRVFLSLSPTTASSQRQGSRRWQPKDLESSGARRAKKRWISLGHSTDHDHEETLVARTNPAASRNRDDKEEEEEQQKGQNSHNNNNEGGGATRPNYGRRHNFLDEVSDDSINIELHNVGPKSRRSAGRLSYPGAVYSGDRAGRRGLATS